MYMDVLEQEVEALSAEVTRLRLMVHRVTQVMEAPIPGPRNNVDPLCDAAGDPAVTPSIRANLQTTVDSYKQILPLVQLLLEQQQQQTLQPLLRKARRLRRTAHRRYHRSRHGTRSEHALSSRSSSRSSVGVAQQAATAASAPSTQITKLSRHSHHKSNSTPTGSDSSSNVIFSSSSSSSKFVENATNLKQRSLQQSSGGHSRKGHLRHVHHASKRKGTQDAGDQKSPAADNGPSPLITIVDQLRAQRILDKEENSSSSTSSLFSGSRTEGNRTASQAVPNAAPSKPQQQQQSSSFHLPASEKGQHRPLQASKDDSVRKDRSAQSGSRTPKAVPQNGHSIPLSVSEAKHFRGEQPASPSKGTYTQSIALPHDDVAGASAGTNSEPNNRRRASTPNAAPSPTSVSGASGKVSSAELPTQSKGFSPMSNKQLPVLASTLGKARLNVSSTSSESTHSSVEAEDPHRRSAHVPQIAMPSTPGAVRTGVILGTRQHISVAAVTRTSVSVGKQKNGHTGIGLRETTTTSDRRLVASPHATTQPIRPETLVSTDASSSSDDDVIFHSLHGAPGLPHRATEYSLKNIPDAASSLPALHDADSRPLKSGCTHHSESLSQEAYSFGLYSSQYSALASPQPHDMEASHKSSHVFSNSLSPSQATFSTPRLAPIVGTRRSLTPGGYYYGYELGLATPTEQSLGTPPASGL